MICDGTEQHSHYKISTDELVYHEHGHSKTEKDFNRLHHHPPTEHDGLSEEELTKNMEILNVPF